MRICFFMVNGWQALAKITDSSHYIASRFLEDALKALEVALFIVFAEKFNR
jgi:hypothetical protein